MKSRAIRTLCVRIRNEILRSQKGVQQQSSQTRQTMSIAMRFHITFNFFLEIYIYSFEVVRVRARGVYQMLISRRIRYMNSTATEKITETISLIVIKCERTGIVHFVSLLMCVYRWLP